MLKSKTTDRICCITTVLMLAASVLLWGAVEPVRGDGSHTVGYESLLFDQSTVHTIEITIDDWDSLIANAASEGYAECTIVVDGEKYSHTAIRAKGNTSLSSVASLGSTRYSFKVEFDHFMEGVTYHGLDKLSLNNLIQDATMMKDYLAYTLMARVGVPAPLCSYVQITVNGEPWGLYLAVEGVEDGFMDRNGMAKGELYKPDSMSFGGGRGNGRDFDVEQFRVKGDEEDTAKTGTVSEEQTESSEAPTGPTDTQPEVTEAPAGTDETATTPASGGNPFGEYPGGGSFPGSGSFPGNSGDSSFPSPPGGGSIPGNAEGGFGFNFGMGNDDVKLVYTDDDPDNYSNIFNNAKTNIGRKDKTRLIESIRKLNAQEDIASVVDMDEVTRYLVVHNFLCNDDSYTGMMVHNYYLYEENGKLSILPWDYNLAFGGFAASENATSTVNSPIDSPVTGGTTESRPLIAWIFSDEAALAEYHETYSRFLAESIENGWLDGEILRVQAMITPYLEKDSSAFYTTDEFNKAVDTLRTFCTKRGESVRGQLDGTIPSTSEGQRESAVLVDAGEISTADMGSMNSGDSSNRDGGFGMPGQGGGNSMPGGFSPPEGMSLPGGGNALPESAGPMPGADGNGPPGAAGNGSDRWILTGACGALLLASLLVFNRFRTHNQ